MHRASYSTAAKRFHVEGGWHPDFIHQVCLPRPFRRDVVGLKHGIADPVSSKIALEYVALSENDLDLVRLHLAIANDIQHARSASGGLIEEKRRARPINVLIGRLHLLPIQG